MRFTSPQPTAAEREAFYTSEYIPDDETRSWNFEVQRRAAIERAAAAVREFARGTRILDVGDAGGGFLDHFDPARWTRAAVEPATVANASRAGDIEAFAGLYPEAVPADRRFDVITMLDLVMLLPDPVAALTAAHHHLAPGGTLAVEIPGNLFRMMLHVGPVPRLRSRGATDLALDVHLFYFDDRSLRWLLDRTGFSAGTVIMLPASRVRNRAVDRGLAGWSAVSQALPFVRRGRPGLAPKYLYLATRT